MMVNPVVQLSFHNPFALSITAVLACDVPFASYIHQLKNKLLPLFRQTEEKQVTEITVQVIYENKKST
jgi:hypothetical protein